MTHPVDGVTQHTLAVALRRSWPRCREVDQLMLGRDVVKMHIPRHRFDRGHFLDCVADADQDRFGDARAPLQERETAVVVAAAETQPMTCLLYTSDAADEE